MPGIRSSSNGLEGVRSGTLVTAETTLPAGDLRRIGRCRRPAALFPRTLPEQDRQRYFKEEPCRGPDQEGAHEGASMTVPRAPRTAAPGLSP